MSGMVKTELANVNKCDSARMKTLIEGPFSNSRQCTREEIEHIKTWLKYHQNDMIQHVLDAKCNPFNVKAYHLLIDMLTDSGTHRTWQKQAEFLRMWEMLFKDCETFAYAGSPARELLNETISRIFGEQFYFHLTVQGRAAEFLLLNGLQANGLMPKGSVVLTNHGFDTTCGHIKAVGCKVIACSPVTTPQRVASMPDSVFFGNLSISELRKQLDSNEGNVSAVLLTLTDNGGGGQPVSMANIKAVTKEAHDRGIPLWIDGCRIAENAAYIKAYEPGYSDRSLQDIIAETMSECEFSTTSFKKIYSHSGGGIFLNKDSPLLQAKMGAVRKSVMELTTVVYGMGFETGYCGRTGRDMVEIVSGLLYAMDPENVANRIGQVREVSDTLAGHGFPHVAGGNALYTASEQVLSNVPLEYAPAEYLQAIMLAATGVRGCALGNRLYGEWRQNGHGWELVRPSEMDSLRAAVMRLGNSTPMLILGLEPMAIAHEQGYLKPLTQGLEVIDYETSGFNHFKAIYEVRDVVEFKKAVGLVNEIFNESARNL